MILSGTDIVAMPWKAKARGFCVFLASLIYMKGYWPAKVTGQDKAKQERKKKEETNKQKMGLPGVGQFWPRQTSLEAGLFCGGTVFPRAPTNLSSIVYRCDVSTSTLLPLSFKFTPSLRRLR